MLVMIGATPEGRKELLGFQIGVRESARSWHELLSDLKARTSGEYLADACFVMMTPVSQEMGPLVNPARFNLVKTHGKRDLSKFKENLETVARHQGSSHGS